MKRIILTAISLMLIGSIVSAETDIVQPQGVYAKIDTKKEIQAIDTFLNGTKSEQDQLAKNVVEHSDQYCPAVFFYLSRYYFYENKYDDAIFWLYAARIRMWYDIKKCTDLSVEDSVDAMSAQMPDLLKLIQFKNIKNSTELLKKAVEWDRNTPHNYDPAWIALHGMKAFMSGDEKSEALNIPEDQWQALAEKNRTEYQESYIEYMDQISPEDFSLIKDKIKELEKEQKQK